MSDSFGDLWASSNPLNSQSQPLRTLGSSSRILSSVTRQNAPDAFSLLTSSSSNSISNSRPITPVPVTKPQSATSRVTTTNITAGDAFGGLVSFSATSGSKDGSLTIAERAAKAERERKEQIEKDKIALRSQNSFWDKYDDVSPQNSGRSSILPTKSTGGEWNFDVLTPATKVTTTQFHHHQKPPPSTIPQDVTWDFDSSETATSAVTNAKQPIADIFGLDDPSDDLLGDGQLSRSRSTEPSREDLPGDFDFGDREEPLLGHRSRQEEEEEDDILGVLAKPVDAVRRVSPQIPDQPPPHAVSSARPALSSRKQSASPPPHIVGRIVEMGFSVQQAKAALCSTSTGVDVDAALEILLRDSNTSTPPYREQTPPPPPPELEANRNNGGTRNNNSSTVSDPASSRLNTPPAQQGLLLQDHADKLMAQASSIGLNMFHRANALWKEGKEKVAKAYEEQKFGSSSTDSVNKGNKSIPKWMEESMIKDDNNDDPLFPSKDAYKSPARRRPPVASQSVEEVSPSIMPANVTPPSVSIPSTPPPPLFSRPTIEVSQATISSSNAHKATGTDHFKLGRFAEAESSYSRAIDLLPTSHLLRVPLLNNRALTRFKIGEYKGSIQDTTEVLSIVTGELGTAWHPGREAALQVDVNLGEAVAKALRRRAEANEGLEKWKEASIDWDRLNATPWINQGLKVDAVKGVGRCRGMAIRQNEPEAPPPEVKSEQVKPKLKPKHVPASASTSSYRPAEAVSRVRAANAAQEREDQDRHDLKDTVDARLEVWRSGKETNIRALIASLDTVLPSTFGWQKVGMAELVTPKQVKVRYTKAIARLHPDKLNANNTTLEERMIANGVFGVLNEAWNATRE